MNDILAQAFQSPVPSYQLALEEQQAILDIQLSTLEMIASNQPAESIFVKLCQMAEALLPNAVASIMMQQPSGAMDVLCAPSVPEAGQLRLNGLVPSETGGSCGNAVYRNEAVFVVDAEKDPRCGDTRDVFREFGLSACWSNPIRNPEGDSIGSFALSSFEIREPGQFHKQLLAVSAYIIGIILQRSRQQQQLEYMAYSDPLTGLANRTSLFLEIQKFIEISKVDSTRFAVLFLDLDRFKNLNDTFGHSVGDDVLAIISQRLKQRFSENCFLSRAGGDEFVILLSADEGQEKISNIAQQALIGLTEPIVYQGHRFQIDASIGAAFYPTDGDSAELLLKHADTAMYQAKKQTAPRICFYEPHFSQKAAKAFTIEHDLHNALKRGQFTLHYQTQIDTETMQVKGVEALIRWLCPERGMVSPANFIPIAEETGLIVPIGEWVVRQSLKEMELLQATIDRPINISINLSGAQLTESDIDTVLKIINDSSLPNNQIELEITETFLVQEAEAAASQLARIREAGIRLAIDDFGIGYSSLAYLKRFKVNTLKIDRMLINDINTDSDDLAIIKAVIALGHSLGLEVIAEGVENKAQVETLKKLSCDTLQGYHFSVPSALQQQNIK